MRESLPPPTCPDLNALKKKLEGDLEAEEVIERLREAHNALRLAAKASMLLMIKLDELLEGQAGGATEEGRSPCAAPSRL